MRNARISAYRAKSVLVRYWKRVTRLKTKGRIRKETIQRIEKSSNAHAWLNATYAVHTCLFLSVLCVVSFCAINLQPSHRDHYHHQPPPTPTKQPSANCRNKKKIIKKNTSSRTECCDPNKPTKNLHHSLSLLFGRIWRCSHIVGYFCPFTYVHYAQPSVNQPWAHHGRHGNPMVTRRCPVRIRPHLPSRTVSCFFCWKCE